MNKIQTWRFKDVFGYLLLLGIGVFFGFIYGHLLVECALYLLSPNRFYEFLGHSPTSPHMAENRYLDIILSLYEGIAQSLESNFVVTVCYRCGEVCGAFWLGSRIAEAQFRYYRLVRLKQRHRMTFFQMREMNPIMHNPLMDMLWAMSYIIAEILIPPSFSLGLGFLITTLLWGSIHLFSIIAGILAVLWIYPHFETIIYKLFERFDLEDDLEDAGLIQIAQASMQEESLALSNSYEDFYGIEVQNSSTLF